MQAGEHDQGDEPLKLPQLRSELSLRLGAASEDGSNGWLIYDPVQHRYFQIDQTAYELLSVWPQCQDANALIDAVAGRFATTVELLQIQELVQFLVESNLTNESPTGDWRYFAASARRRANAHGPLMRLAHNYLFFRIPLWRPQRFLTSTLPLVAPLYTRTAATIILLLGLVGLYLTSRQWDNFLHTTDFFFSWQGALCFGLALIFVKALHELGHAYTAVRYGCYVPTLGLAFMMLTPLLYTDVTDAWKLRDRRQRLRIDSAGIVVELAIAMIATFLWAFLPDGPLRSAAFMLATAGWIMSLAINLNPFMRFDGYYIFAEMIGIENLQSRAFALARWRLREILFGLGHPCPEHLQKSTILWLTMWGWATWIYRLFLFIGIALLVYTYFFKVLGIALFIFEIVFLVARPVAKEIGEWYKMRKQISKSRRSALTAVMTAAAICALIVPWSGNVQVPAIARLGDTQPIHARRPAYLKTVHVSAGQTVERGQLLFTLQSDEIDNRLATVATREKLVRLRLNRRNVDSVDREESLVLRRQLAALLTERAGLIKERKNLELRSPIAGRVLELDREFHGGRWIKPADRLALIGKPSSFQLTGFISEDDIWRVKRGTTGQFVPDAPFADAAEVSVRDIAVSGVHDLGILSLASDYGGPISTQRDKQDRLVPTHAHYRVALDTTKPFGSGLTAMRGMVHLKGRPESLLARFWRRGLTILVRESGA
ncbi:MAG: biotin/lipoyl-binding protein [Pseudomonadota bacterium]